jgi:hypothetical protein
MFPECGNLSMKISILEISLQIEICELGSHDEFGAPVTVPRQPGRREGATVDMGLRKIATLAFLGMLATAGVRASIPAPKSESSRPATASFEPPAAC